MIKDIVDLVLNFADRYKAGRADLFNYHVEPLKDRVHEIHRDYMKSFVSAKSSLENKEVPVTDILSFLEQRRIELVGERDLVKSLADALLSMDRTFSTPFIFVALEEFAMAVSNYFVASNAIARASWYSDFINFMQVSRIMEESNFFDKNYFGNDPRMDTIEHLNMIIDKRLPRALSEVNKNYAILRSALL